MIDIHSHVLPGIDDGASSLHESVAMCRRAADEGCRALVATPHQRNDRWANEDAATLRELVADVQAEVGDLIRLLPGGEVRIDSELVRELEAPDRSGLMTIADSDYLLIEFDRRQLGPPPLNVVYDLRALGYRPVIAHPEFIPQLAEDLPLLEQLREAGALLQLTGMSVTGEFGATPRGIVDRLLDADLADVVASDAHTMNWRPPGLAEAYARVTRGWGAARAERLFRDNPAAIVENRPLP